MGSINPLRPRLVFLRSVAGLGSSCGGGHRDRQQPAEAVQIRCRIQVKLDPIPPEWITLDGGIIAEAVLYPSHPARVIRRSITPGASKWAISRLAVNKAGLSP
jgi:hypothetical protein